MCTTTCLSFACSSHRTQNTEAYGLKVLESTERIDAARHTTDDIEMIAWVASPEVANYTIISVNSCLAKRRQFCGFQKLKARRLLCFLSSVGTTSKGSTNNRTPTSPINPSLYHSKYRKNPNQALMTNQSSLNDQPIKP